MEHLRGNLPYGTITTIAVAPSDPQTIYVGTDDGNVQLTTDGGTNWLNITGSLPKRWVTRIAVDPLNALHAFVTLSGYRHDSYQPHVFETSQGGGLWNDISYNLPEAPVNDIIVDTLNYHLYVATDVGVFAMDAHLNEWYNLANGLPNVPVTDLRLHYPSYSLTAATYGRSMYNVSLDATVGVSYPDENSTQWEVYPNPVKKEFVISSNIEKWIDRLTIEVYDAEGKQILTASFENVNLGMFSESMNLPAQSPKGTYHVQLKYDGHTASKQLIKQ